MMEVDQTKNVLPVVSRWSETNQGCRTRKGDREPDGTCLLASHICNEPFTPFVELNGPRYDLAQVTAADLNFGRTHPYGTSGT